MRRGRPASVALRRQRAEYSIRCQAIGFLGLEQHSRDASVLLPEGLRTIAQVAELCFFAAAASFAIVPVRTCRRTIAQEHGALRLCRAGLHYRREDRPGPGLGVDRRVAIHGDGAIGPSNAIEIAVTESGISIWS
jgi:hypothetical protein